MSLPGGLFSLFIGSLLASTLVPGGVEGLLYVMVKEGTYTWQSLLVVSSIGNTLGGIITWWIGAILQFRLVQTRRNPGRLARWFTIKPDSLQRIRKWGAPALLLSWMPVIGDPLCLAAGFLGLRFWPCLLMIAIGKTVRYIVLLWILEHSVS